MKVGSYSFSKKKWYKHKITGRIGKPLKANEDMVCMIFTDWEHGVWCWPEELEYWVWANKQIPEPVPSNLFHLSDYRAKA